MKHDDLIDLLFRHPETITSIVYSNIDGKEKLTVNGEEIKEEEYDDTITKKIVSGFKSAIEALDDDSFTAICEELSDKLDLTRFDELLESNSFTEEESDEVLDLINQFKSVTVKHLQNQLNEIHTVLKKFN